MEADDHRRDWRTRWGLGHEVGAIGVVCGDDLLLESHGVSIADGVCGGLLRGILNEARVGNSIPRLWQGCRIVPPSRQPGHPMPSCVAARSLSEKIWTMRVRIFGSEGQVGVDGAGHAANLAHQRAAIPKLRELFRAHA